MNPTQQFYEMIAREYSRIEAEKLDKAERICRAWEAYQRGEITAEECDRRIAEATRKETIS